ncbi:MAG TPA: glycosyltransferase [Chthonomonadaceae bacterium]|nr:glycosyltransferase [Chthonomonadaceae bacterium]
MSTKPLRIGMFSESFHPVQNGVTTSVRTLIGELRKLGHHVWVFAPEHHDQPAHETNVVRFPSFVTQFNPEYPLVYPFLPRIRLASQIERLKLDVIHTHSPFVLGLTGADLAIRRGIALVSTFHTLYNEYSHYVSFLPESFTQGILEAYLPWYYNRCAIVTAPSQVAADHLAKTGVDRPIEVVPTGIPIPDPESIDARKQDSVRDRLGVASGQAMLLYAGRLAPEKQIGWLIDTFACILDRAPDAILAIAGGGPMADELADHARATGVARSVRFLGPVPRAEMDPIYAAADVFVFPSPSETQGLVIGEARAAGTPAVVVDAGGGPETVRDGIDGFRVPEGDKAAFASRVLELLNNRELLAQVSARARETARDQSPERMSQRMLEIYERARQIGATADSGAAEITVDADESWEAAMEPHGES